MRLHQPQLMKSIWQLLVAIVHSSADLAVWCTAGHGTPQLRLALRLHDSLSPWQLLQILKYLRVLWIVPYLRMFETLVRMACPFQRLQQLLNRDFRLLNNRIRTLLIQFMITIQDHVCGIGSVRSHSLLLLLVYPLHVRLILLQKVLITSILPLDWQL